MIFVVIPLLLPPLLVQVPDAIWVAALKLLILQTSFMLPPSGYVVMMVRDLTPQRIEPVKLVRALVPYRIVQIAVLVFPQMLWREAARVSASKADSVTPVVDANTLLNERLNQNQEIEENKPAARWCSAS